MKARHLCPLLLASLATPAFAAGATAPAKKTLAPHPVVKTFYVSGVKTEIGANKIVDAVKKLPSVTDVKELTPTSGYIRVAFDTHAIASHLIAQTILDNGGQDIHITFTVPQYSQNVEKLDALFAKVEKERHVKIEAKDKTKGEFKLTYLPITPDPNDPRKVGFNYGHLGHPLHDPPPKGLGLQYQMPDVPGPDSPAAKAKRKTKK
ncbi:MAG TPA: hypothetical protein PLU30_07610 [Verrucomicrobiae bacterium]|nr:hypothetical protein [Verrucomicrobiae bacterium]